MPRNAYTISFCCENMAEIWELGCVKLVGRDEDYTENVLRTSDGHNEHKNFPFRFCPWCGYDFKDGKPVEPTVEVEVLDRTVVDVGVDPASGESRTRGAKYTSTKVFDDP